ncbi:hypothetical protein [Ferriphaselus sp. R-1]|uniref:hypothetical protein n=1 Tax=Ferriphaselus sp. R-1 TaxID=1485544 RepID=UPI00054FD8EB|nr:hypothetical protein [Ferriphaselus sp. R-1]
MGKNTQLLAMQNELAILGALGRQIWCREKELQLITGMSSYMVEVTTMRLADRGMIHRIKQKHGAGAFCTLRTAGSRYLAIPHRKDVSIPDSWPHDALAVQTLFFLKKTYDSDATVHTESVLRKNHDPSNGKIVDGKLVSKLFGDISIEQEMSKKDGAPLRSQSKAIVRRALAGEKTVISYPYPPANTSSKFDHEKRQLQALQTAIFEAVIQASKIDEVVDHIYFCRIQFASLRDFANVMPSNFSLISLRNLAPNLTLNVKSAGKHYKFDDKPLLQFGGYGPIIGTELFTISDRFKVRCKVEDVGYEQTVECTYNDRISIPLDLSGCRPGNWPATRAVLEKQISEWLDRRIEVAR